MKLIMALCGGVNGVNNKKKFLEELSNMDYFLGCSN
jgi:hypothetical protein